MILLMKEWHEIILGMHAKAHGNLKPALWHHLSFISMLIHSNHLTCSSAHQLHLFARPPVRPSGRLAYICGTSNFSYRYTYTRFINTFEYYSTYCLHNCSPKTFRIEFPACERMYMTVCLCVYVVGTRILLFDLHWIQCFNSVSEYHTEPMCSFMHAHSTSDFTEIKLTTLWVEFIVWLCHKFHTHIKSKSKSRK